MIGRVLERFTVRTRRWIAAGVWLALATALVLVVLALFELAASPVR